MDTFDDIEVNTARTLLDQLLTDSRLYTRSKDYKDLLDFVVRLRNFAPFNAMLLQIQKPGLSYAASARDWQERFGRSPKEGARPLLILWPFGPVALVYDVMDTNGQELPQDVKCFPAHGPITKQRISELVSLAEGKHIECCVFDGGDRKAGAIRVVVRATTSKEYTHYRMNINRNHEPPVQFTTLAHELAHLFLGHLGEDKKLKIPDRSQLLHAQDELEAESVAYLVCARNGVTPKSETYLSAYINDETTIAQLDIYRIMWAAGQVETLLGLSMHTAYNKPTKTNPEIPEQQPLLFDRTNDLANRNIR